MDINEIREAVENAPPHVRYERTGKGFGEKTEALGPVQSAFLREFLKAGPCCGPGGCSGCACDSDCTCE